jgi:hypothetical protein
MENVAMQTIPKKYFVFVLAAVLFASVVFMLVAQLILKSQTQEGFISGKSVYTWIAGGILLSLFALSTPWRWQRRLLSLSTGAGTISTRRIRAFFLSFSYIPLIAPLVYGLVLFMFGLPITVFYTFVALSIIGALVWSIYNLMPN